ncbi:MAG: MFS transporter [Legionellaceae bacterium]|nr:MFS transporter [Legionellaceae bacterium]
MHMRDVSLSSRRQLYLGITICLVGALFYCYEFLLRILPGTLQGELSAAFGHISATTFGQLAALYYFAYSPMQLPVGMLIDRFGPRSLLSFACLCCTIGSYLFMMFSSLWLAGVGRVLVGFGSSFAFVGGLTLMMHWLPRRYFSLATGLMTTLGMLGLMYGGIKITALAQTLALTEVLMLTVVGGGIITVLIIFVVRDGPGAEHTQKHQLSEFFSQVWQVLISKEVWLIGLVGAFLYTSLSVFGELWGKSYLEQAHHLTKLEAAKGVSAMFFGWAVGAPLGGYFSDKTGRRTLFLVGGAFFALLCISSIIYLSNLSYVTLMVLLFLYGVFSGTEIIAFVMAKENSGAELSGTVFAVINMIVTLGGVIFQPLVGFLLDLHINKALITDAVVYSVADYRRALLVLPASLIGVMLIGFFLKDATSRLK